MRTGGNFHKDLTRDLERPGFARLFGKEKARLKLSERLRACLAGAGLSVRKAAARMGTSKSQVERIISDPDANVGIDTLIKFAAVTGRRLEIQFRG